MANSAFSPPAVGSSGIATVNIQDSAVTTAKIADEAVTNAKMAAGSLFEAAAAATSLSGTAFELTGIPAGTQYIRCLINGASFNAANTYPAFNLGTSGSYATSGYSGTRGHTLSSGAAGAGDFSGDTCFDALGGSGWAAADLFTGVYEFFLLDPTNHTWMYRATWRAVNSGNIYSGHTIGQVDLSGALTRIKLFDAQSGNSFDAGTGLYQYR
jgi:hypothetical protein